MELLEGWRPSLAERRVTAMWVVRAFDVAERHQARRRVRCNATLRQTLALQRGEATLGHGVIVRVAAGACRGAHAKRSAALAERERTV